MFFLKVIFFLVLSISAVGSDYFNVEDIKEDITNVDTFGRLIRNLKLKLKCCPGVNKINFDREIETNQNNYYVTRYFYDLPPLEALLILAEAKNFQVEKGGGFLWITQRYHEHNPPNWIKQYAGKWDGTNAF